MPQSEENPSVLLEYPRLHGAEHLPERPEAEPALSAPVSRIPRRVIRSACEHCGAHTNAVWTFRVGGCCPTCGSFRLAAMEGAELITTAQQVA
jgi:hypothetical protein